jgi:putative endonuclease
MFSTKLSSCSILRQREGMENTAMTGCPSFKKRAAAGRDGEAAAARYLEGLGWTIAGRNCRLPSGEIDIIAVDSGCLVIVEVKTRRSVSFGSPFEAVDLRKQRRLAAAALEYMAAQGLDMPVRFDVAAVVPDTTNSFRVELLRNAFECEEP